MRIADLYGGVYGSVVTNSSAVTVLDVGGEIINIVAGIARPLLALSQGFIDLGMYPKVVLRMLEVVFHRNAVTAG